MEFTGVVKDEDNELEDSNNTFKVDAVNSDSAADKIAKKYISKYKLCSKHEVFNARIIIGKLTYSFDYFECWDILTIQK
tara:strand:- start:369 stop:605 length:237 start_codon:yes stop_codon:yes gene_type:complete